MSEMRRQSIHIAGIAFIALAQFIGKLIVVWYALAALGLLIWSWHIRRQSKLGLLDGVETELRRMFLRFERTHEKPFIGAAWFFGASGMAFLIFPYPIASAVCMMLVIGDGLATVIGHNFGRHKILKGKSVEGSLACWLGSLSAILFLPLPKVLIGATIATFLEILPALTKHRNLVDDNWLITMVTGFVLWLI